MSNAHTIGAITLLLALTATLLASTSPAAQTASAQDAGEEEQAPIIAADLLRIKTITSVVVSTDGAKAVYAVKSIHTKAGDKDEADTYEYRTHLWQVDLTDPESTPVQLTFGERSDTDPRISPDGRLLAFVRSAPSSDDAADDKDAPKPQVWLMPLGAPGEARQATDLKHGASTPRWRPDSQAILVSSDLPMSELPGEPAFKPERPGRSRGDFDRPDPDKDASPAPRPQGDLRSIRNWLAGNASDNNPFVVDRLAFQAEHGLQREQTFSNLFLVDLASDDRVTQITHAFHDHNDPQWHPEGSVIVYVSSADVQSHPDRELRTTLYIVKPDGEHNRMLQHQPDLILDAPRISPDGDVLIFRTRELKDRLFKQAHIAAMSVQDQSKKGWLTAEWDADANDPVPASDGTVLFTSPHEGAVQLMRTNYEGAPDDLSAVTHGPLEVMHFDEGAGRIIAAVSTPTNPCELYEIESDGSLRLLTNLNASWLARKKLSTPVEHWLTREDGARIQYWVMPPTNVRPGEHYPLALEIHGGPMAMWGPAEMTMWHEFQLLCSFGYGVVYSNPRGSNGYGFDFQKGNYADWGDTPTGDVLACLDEAIAKNNWVDKDRLFIAGGSYAGYLTAWIVAHDHRFLAAVAQRGVYDLETFFGEGNAWRLVEEAFGGFPWEPKTQKLLRHESPFTYVDQITTPLLIIHGSSDLRTGVAQSEMMFRALKELHRPVEYIRYPGAGHDLSREGDPRQRLDRLLRIVEFFERYADNTRQAPIDNGD